MTMTICVQTLVKAATKLVLVCTTVAHTSNGQHKKKTATLKYMQKLVGNNSR